MHQGDRAEQTYRLQMVEIGLQGHKMEKKQDIEEYISVSEFAKRAGVSRQLVYKRIDNELTEFCKLVDNKKMLNIRALELFQKQKLSTKVSTGFTGELTKVSTKLSTKFTVYKLKLQHKIDLLELENQHLKEKVESLETQTAADQEKIESLLKLLDQQQQLSAISAKKIEMLEAKIQEPTPPVRKWWRFWS